MSEQFIGEIKLFVFHGRTASRQELRLIQNARKSA